MGAIFEFPWVLWKRSKQIHFLLGRAPIFMGSGLAPSSFFKAKTVSKTFGKNSTTDSFIIIRIRFVRRSKEKPFILALALFLKKIALTHSDFL